MLLKRIEHYFIPKKSKGLRFVLKLIERPVIKVVKKIPHSLITVGKIADEMFECVWRFCEIGA